MADSEQQRLKQRVAEAALARVRADSILGIGSGSTVDCFIDALASSGLRIEAAVPASEASGRRLTEHGIELRDLNAAGTLDLYIDGADEFDAHRRLIKGGGGALTREKIIAAASRQFVCIVDETKKVGVLGRFPLPVEVIPMARSHVGRELRKRGAQPELRENTKTDNGNLILDAYGLTILDPPKLEAELNNIAGVVTNGIFARRPADVLLLAKPEGVETLRRKT